MPKPLAQFDLIERLPGYPLAEVVQQMNDMRKQGHDVINLGMGNPDLPTADFIVNKLCEAAKKPKNHRYSVSRGIPKLRQALCSWYDRKFDVKLDFDREVIATMGAKEGFSHLIMAMTQPGDVVLAPNPTYPIHYFAPVIARNNVRDVRTENLSDYFSSLEKAIKSVQPRPKILIASFPSNPTGLCADLDFFKDLVKVAKKYGLYIIHDLAYADICFDGYKAPSILQVPEARSISIEFYSLSKGYNMPGWRVGFAAGNERLVGVLKKIKSYLDYGMFQPIQIAATVALNEGDKFVASVNDIYHRRRDVLVDGLNSIGWPIEKPKATMFVWAKIPEQFTAKGSLAFSKLMLSKADVCCAPGIGFGSYGDGHVRFALVENEKRIRQAVKNLKSWIKTS